MVIAQEFSISALTGHLLVFLAGMLGVGLLSDLVFSPMHRLLHHPAIYKSNHKVHHEYTNKITSLVLYHGTSLDNFLMPLSTTLGVVLWWCLVNPYFNPMSNVNMYMVVPATILSHAHDVRCGRLMAPILPDGLNFVAYHHAHHLNPNKNFGLTKPSDMFWDWILGVDTILEPGKEGKGV